jgi:hypothetical protein
MSDHVPPSPDREPQPEPALADRVRDDLAAVSELVAEGIEVDGEVQVTSSTWVLYGHADYDGETVVGVYHDEVEATEVLHLAPHVGEVPRDRDPEPRDP